MESYKEAVSAALQQRDIGLAKVEPKLQGLPDELPLDSRDLPKAVLTAREIEITESYSVVQLLDILRKREIKVEEVTRAFLRRAAVAQAAVSNLHHHYESRLMTAFVDKLFSHSHVGRSH